MSVELRIFLAYRNALRASRLAFKGDVYTMNAARQQLKICTLAPDYLGKSMNERIDLLDQIATYLKRNIVQGIRKEDGRYFLNLHEESELGDNDSIKKPKSTLGNPSAPTGGCCGAGQKVMKEKRA